MHYSLQTQIASPFFYTSPYTPVFRSSATQTPTFQPLKRVWINLQHTRVADTYAVVEFHAWFKFYFLLFQTHYYTLPHPPEKK